jgi:hypothetical protein
MKILEKQGYHLVLLVILLLGVVAAARGDVLDGSLAGFSTGIWFWLAIIVPIIHQIFVLILWRGELYYQMLSNAFGEKAFYVWSIGFMVLFTARPVTILVLAVANRGTLNMPVWLAWLLSLICLGLAIYLFYSVIKFFGLKRALGIDHFQPDKYRNQPLVKEGIFKWTSNGMYLFGFLLLWVPGLLFMSRAALLAALFNHLYIWVHYYFTESPDMKYIYAPEEKGSQ